MFKSMLILFLFISLALCCVLTGMLIQYYSPFDWSWLSRRFHFNLPKWSTVRLKQDPPVKKSVQTKKVVTRESEVLESLIVQLESVDNENKEKILEVIGAFISSNGLKKWEFKVIHHDNGTFAINGDTPGKHSKFFSIVKEMDTKGTKGVWKRIK